MESNKHLKEQFLKLNHVSATVFLNKIENRTNQATLAALQLNPTYTFSAEYPPAPSAQVIHSLSPVIQDYLNDAVENTPLFIPFPRMTEENIQLKDEAQRKKLTIETINKDIANEQNANLSHYLLVCSPISIFYKDVLFWMLKNLLSQNIECSLIAFTPTDVCGHALVKMTGDISEESLNTVNGSMLVDSHAGIYIAKTPAQQTLLEEFCLIYDRTCNETAEYFTQRNYALMTVVRCPKDQVLFQATPHPVSPRLKPEHTSSDTSTAVSSFFSPCVLPTAVVRVTSRGSSSAFWQSSPVVPLAPVISDSSENNKTPAGTAQGR